MQQSNLYHKYHKNGLRFHSIKGVLLATRGVLLAIIKASKSHN
ncbi:hypothetical protein A607_0430 [Helicobacter pylori UMB_G1]|nr:hypothetical protein A607_0430 [Helicobacter pylori UMB_G1]